MPSSRASSPLFSASKVAEIKESLVITLVIQSQCVKVFLFNARFESESKLNNYDDPQDKGTLQGANVKFQVKMNQKFDVDILKRFFPVERHNYVGAYFNLFWVWLLSNKYLLSDTDWVRI